MNAFAYPSAREGWPPAAWSPPASTSMCAPRATSPRSDWASGQKSSSPIRRRGHQLRAEHLDHALGNPDPVGQPSLLVPVDVNDAILKLAHRLEHGDNGEQSPQ